MEEKELSWINIKCFFFLGTTCSAPCTWPSGDSSVPGHRPKRGSSRSRAGTVRAQRWQSPPGKRCCRPAEMGPPGAPEPGLGSFVRKEKTNVKWFDTRAHREFHQGPESLQRGQLSTTQTCLVRIRKRKHRHDNQAHFKMLKMVQLAYLLCWLSAEHKAWPTKPIRMHQSSSGHTTLQSVHDLMSGTQPMDQSKHSHQGHSSSQPFRA